MEVFKKVGLFLLQWGGRMCGIVALPFFWYGTMHGLSQGAAYVDTAFIALIVCAFLELLNNHHLSSKLKPSLKVACSPEIAGCAGLSVCKTNWAHRIKIKNYGVAPVEGCEARLTNISANGFPVWDGNYALLTFAPSQLPDKLSKSLRHRQDNWIDCLFTCRDVPTLRVGTENNVWNYTPLEQLFDHIGEYRLTVDISSRTSPSIKLILSFAWKGDWTTATLRLESVEPKECLDLNP